MCTAISFTTRDHYFGRNLDLEYSYHETITITPRNYPFRFRHFNAPSSHLAIIGVAFVSNGYPLYYDAVNEAGLGMAGLNFPDNASWKPYDRNKENITPFELIPRILGYCKNVDEACEVLRKINPLNEAFSLELPLSPLHWLLADAQRSVTVEFCADGLHLHENPMGVLTNNPPFEFQMFNLSNYLNLTKEVPKNTFAPGLSLEQYSRGMGAIGLPGDLSSASRFVKVAFTKLNSLSGPSETESVTQFFHILRSVAQQRGCVHLGGDKYEYTIYSSCCNTDTGTYYYTTYEDQTLRAVNLRAENLDGADLISYPLIKDPEIRYQN
ncbi:MAG: choloylglycine hydrolase [Kiritimatiellae bacterium]|nr:choloylglycine hydrolase [Kiritimatiellia bacterium]